MKIFAIVDLHSDLEQLDKVIKKIKREKPDVIVSGGDLSIFGTNHEIILIQLDSLEIPFLAIHGNHEDVEDMKIAEKSLSNLTQIHAKGNVIDDVLFLGYGDGGFLVEDYRLEKLIPKFEKLIKKNKDKKIVLVSHGPPYGTKTDMKSKDDHVGSKTLREFIKKYKPDVVITGHIHECDGRSDRIGNTRIINPGYKGKFIEI